MTVLRTKEFRLTSLDEESRTVTFVASTRAYVESWEPRDDGALVQVFESIVEWDFSRWLDNPTVLWAHESCELPIGRGLSAAESEDGVEIRVRFASERHTPRAEQVWQSIRDNFVRAVSVGFARLAVLSEEMRDGVPYRKIRAALHEVSVVPVPADAGALARGQRAALQADGTVAEVDVEESRKKALSAAGKALASARKPRPTLDADEAVRLDFGRLGKAERTGAGGYRIPARFCRTGVLTYRQPDGTTFRELRLPEEVFHPDSIATLRSAPVTDNHPYEVGGLVDPKTYRSLTIGNVEEPQKQGDRYLGGNIVVNDQDAIDAIDRGEREDVSAGYVRKLDRTPGVWNGEPYDGIQRRIRYNHVAILPPGRGRAGRDVGLRLDATDAVCVTDEEDMTVKIRLDGQDYEVGSEAHIAKLGSMHQAEVQTKDEKIAELSKALDETRAKLDAKDADAEEERKKREQDEADKKKAEADAEEERKKRFKARVRRALRAARIMEEDDEEKLDAMLDLSDRDLMIAAIKHVDANFDKVDETDDYIRARFDSIEEARTDGVDSVVRSLELAKRAAKAKPDDEVEKARQEMIERNRNLYKIKEGA